MPGKKGSGTPRRFGLRHSEKELSERRTIASHHKNTPVLYVRNYKPHGIPCALLEYGFKKSKRKIL
jgi:hypothetical protein